MASETEVIKKIQYDLRGSGGDWETTYEDVLGETHLVFKNRHKSIREMFNANIAKWSSREFLVLEQTRITYEEFRLRVESTAFRMQTQCGINQGDRVAILAANSPEWVISFFAATHLGAIVSALNGWWTETEIRHAIELTDPSLIVGDSRRLARAGLVLGNFEVIDFGKGMPIKETINMDHMSEVIWLTKYLGDYNINKFGKDLVLENQGYVLKLRRIF